MALLSALLELPSSVRAAAARAEGVGELTRTQRDLAPAYAADLDPALLLRARELLPPDATYHVAVGEAFAAHDVTREAAAPLAAYWLLPRRQLTDPAAAEWILAYGVPLERLPVTGTVLAEPAEGQLLVRVRR